MKKLLLALPVVMLLAAGCSSSQPTSQQNQAPAAQSVPSQPTATPAQPTSVSNTNATYFSTWTDQPTDNPNLEIYSVSNGKATQLFSSPSNQTETVIGVISTGILSVNNNSDQGILSLSNPNTHQVQALITAQPHHTIVAALSPDNNMIAYAEHCAITCTAVSGQPNNVIKLYNLQTQATTEIYQDSTADNNQFYYPYAWEDNTTVVLAPGMEVGEGPIGYSQLILLNTQTKQTSTVAFGKAGASFFAISPDGQTVAYTSSDSNSDKKTYTGSINLVSLSNGSTKVLKSTSFTDYDILKWQNNNQLVAMTTAIVNHWTEGMEGLTPDTGKNSLELITVSNGNTSPVITKAEPDSLLSVSSNQIYYTSNTPAPQNYLKTEETLHLYDLQKSSDNTVFQSPRSISQIPPNLFY